MAHGHQTQPGRAQGRAELRGALLERSPTTRREKRGGNPHHHHNSIHVNRWKLRRISGEATTSPPCRMDFCATTQQSLV